MHEFITWNAFKVIDNFENESINVSMTTEVCNFLGQYNYNCKKYMCWQLVVENQ